MSDKSDARDERSWIAGQRSVYEKLFTEAVTHLGLAVSADGKQLEGAYAVERNATVRVLRRLCEEFGDNEWDDELHFEDVIEKHLAPYLHDRKRKRGG